MELKYKIILKTSHKNKSRVDSCVKTWLSNLDYICLTDKLLGIYPEISGSNSDDYSSNEEKTVFLINKIREGMFSEYDWLVFIDDDAILNVKLFNKIVGGLDKNYVYGLDTKGTYKRDVTLHYPSGGAGYFISPSTIQKTTIPMPLKGIGWEDVAMGMWMRDCNIPINNTLKLNGWFPLQKYWDRINREGNNYAKQMIVSLTEEENKMLTEHLTHHYIRWFPLMEYIYNIQQIQE